MYESSDPPLGGSSPPVTAVGELSLDADSGDDGKSVSSECLKKVDLLLKAVGDTPIMKKKRWQVSADKETSWVVSFIRRYLKLDSAESLFVYVNQSFAPAPNHSIGNLYECFGSEGRLVLNYCCTQAWG